METLRVLPRDRPGLSFCEATPLLCFEREAKQEKNEIHFGGSPEKDPGPCVGFVGRGGVLGRLLSFSGSPNASTSMIGATQMNVFICLAVSQTYFFKWNQKRLYPGFIHPLFMDIQALWVLWFFDFIQAFSPGKVRPVPCVIFGPRTQGAH